jgi:hypothetical protein
VLRAVESCLRPRGRAAIVAAMGVVTLALLASASFGAGAPAGTRVDMRVLLLSADGTEPTFGAWKAALTREGVPFDAKVADASAPLTDATFADYAAHHARYQAVILATGDLGHRVANVDGTVSFPSALSDPEWTALTKFEAAFGIRQFSDSTQPSPLHGLNAATNTGEQGGSTGQLTAAGLQVFPYLKGPVPIENPTAAVDTFGYQATPAAQVAPAAFQTLLGGPGGSSYLGVYTHPDGREEMVSTLDGNENQLHDQLLRHGIINWVTRGVHFGYQRNYFEMEVDDIFLPDDRWDATLKRTLVDGPTTASNEVTCAAPPAPAGTPQCRPIRMVPADVTRLLTWQQTNGLKLDMVFNGGGSDEFRAENAGADTLADALLPNVSAFHWINHTFTHPQLDTLPQATIVGQVADNVAWARSHGIPVDPSELVTGEHSGLHNAATPAAFAATGVRWTAADNSREPTPYAIGPALTVPRFPTNIYYNVATQAEQLDEYNAIYLPPSAGGVCVASATNTCRTAPATWTDFVGSEAGIMFGHLMGNDPRPHYAHQSNLAEEGVLYPVLDELLRRYHLYLNPPPVQLSLAGIGAAMQRQAAWNSAVTAGKVSGYLQDGRVNVTAATALEAPITGTPEGEEYGGAPSRWFPVSPSAPIGQAAPPTAVTGAAVRTAPPGARPVASRGAGRGSLRLRRLRLFPRRFAVAHSRRAARRRHGRPREGATLTWLMDEPAAVHVSIRRRVQRSRAAEAACAAAAARRAKACASAAPVTALDRRAIAGENTIRFSGRVGRRPLRPGRYAAVVTARTADGRAAAPLTLGFQVVRG